MQYSIAVEVIQILKSNTTSVENILKHIGFKVIKPVSHSFCVLDINPKVLMIMTNPRHHNKKQLLAFCCGSQYKVDRLEYSAGLLYCTYFI